MPPPHPTHPAARPHLNGQRLPGLEESTQQRVAVADLLSAQAPAVAQVAVLPKEERSGQQGAEEHGVVGGAARVGGEIQGADVEVREAPGWSETDLT